MEPRFFPTPADFREWLEQNHEAASELWVGFYKKGTGKRSLTWPESVDEALCVGWIDGIRKRLDDERYVIRFTPRRPGSNWSAVNIRKMEELLAADRVLPAGLEAWRARPDRTAGYSYEERDRALTDDYRQEFEAQAEAWEYFQAQPPWYRRTAMHWVMSAKREETRRRRLGVLIASSLEGEAVPPLKRS